MIVIWRFIITAFVGSLLVDRVMDIILKARVINEDKDREGALEDLRGRVYNLEMARSRKDRDDL